MEIMYIAYDGTEFKNEKECDDYEKEHNKYIEDYGKYLYCEDIENNKIDLSKNPSDVDRVYRISVKGEYGIELCKRLYSDFGVYMPTDTGDWEYNHDTDKYERIDFTLTVLEQKVRALKNYKKRALKQFDKE